MPAPDAASSSGLRAALVAIAALAVAVPTWVVSHPPAIPRPVAERVRLPRRVVPAVELPPVEPVKFVELAPDDARAYNASVPFVSGPNPSARPFRFAGGPEDRARATDCLAAAVLYEAGDDAEGERAVAQVVLNRLRHPAFPKTVCGVVFEGSERTTGCQFTFTCDGALARPPSENGWRRAREIAAAALSGSVYKVVGYATHYHTDWVVPYWQSSLDKIAAVHTHLFFRWSGWWGTPPAFNRQVQKGEPAQPQLAGISDVHGMGAALLGADTAVANAAAVQPGIAQPLASDSDTFLVLLNKGSEPGGFAALALAACGERPRCKFMGWTDRAALASTVPLTPEQMDKMSFSYLRDRPGGYEKALWNCADFRRPDRRQCMKQQVFMTAAPMPAASATPAATGAQPLHAPEELGGVRRRSQPEPVPSGTPTPPVGTQIERPTGKPRTSQLTGAATIDRRDQPEGAVRPVRR